MTRNLYDHVVDEAFLDGSGPPYEPPPPPDPMPLVEIGLIDVNGQEVDYPGYERGRPKADWWDTDSQGHLVNIKPIEFPVCESGRYDILSFGVWYRGKLIDTAELERRIHLEPGDTPKFEAGGISISHISGDGPPQEVLTAIDGEADHMPQEVLDVIDSLRSGEADDQ